MDRKPEFYERYLIAVFRRGRAKVLPMKYINRQAKSVLKEDEMVELEKALDRLIAAGIVEKVDDGYSLDKEKGLQAVEKLKGRTESS